MTSYLLNSYLFFIIQNGKIICWDYKNHQQYEIDKEHFNRLVKFSRKEKLPLLEIDQELLVAKLIVSAIQEDEWNWDLLSKIYHFGTQIIKETVDDENEIDSKSFSSEYLKLSEEILPTSPPLLIERGGKKIILPPPDNTFLENYSLLACLKERKTCRSFNKESISIQTVSTLLASVFGVIRSDDEEYKQFGYQQIGLRKSSPSGGGLHSTEAYLLAQHVNGLAKGIYHYQSHNHVLTLIQAIDITSRIPDLFCGQYFARDLSMGIFLTSRFDKLWHKYPHSRAYRVALLDAGHLSQTFQLVSTSLKLNPWLTGAFIDEEVIELLKINNICEQPLFFLGAGYGPKSALDPITKNLLSEDGVDAR